MSLWEIGDTNMLDIWPLKCLKSGDNLLMDQIKAKPGKFVVQSLFKEVLCRREELLTMARHIVVHNMKHNAEVEACDLLIEIERLDLLQEHVLDVDHPRVCLYLLRFVLVVFMLLVVKLCSIDS